jgi:transposase InsO family protein
MRLTTCPDCKAGSPIWLRLSENQAEARMAIFDFIEGWYNPRRLHSALGNKSPMSYEKAALDAA